MQDKVQKVLDTVNTTWGPLDILGIERAIACVKKAIDANVTDNNVKHAIFSLVMIGLESDKIDPDATFVDKQSILAIFQGHIDEGSALYIVVGYYAHPDRDEVGTYCEHLALPPSKRISGDFNEVVNDAHELLTKLIDEAPDSITDCEIKISVVDDGSIIPMGGWMWNRHQQRTFWGKPEGRQ